MHPQIEVRIVKDWAVYEFGDGATTRLAAGALVAYWVTVDGETYAWPQADSPGLDKVYTTPFDIPAGELRDLAADMWTDHVAEVGAQFLAEGRVVTVREVEHDDRGSDGSWKTGYVLAAVTGGEPVRYRLDRLTPRTNEPFTVTEFVNSVFYGANFNRGEE